jgi:hypothetical protein
VVEEDDEEEEVVKVGSNVCAKASAKCVLQTIYKKSEMLFVRGMFLPSCVRLWWITDPSTGDSVVLISPQAPS